MSNAFLEKLIQYKEKCDAFIDSGAAEFLSAFSCDMGKGKYADALIRHSRGGKRIRACLVAVGYGLFEGFDKCDEVLLPSMSYELFQTGILAHDDIIDNSDYRRFKPSMHKDLGNGHDGVSKSICVGDFGIVSAIEILQKANVSDAIKLKAISHQNKVFSDTIAGELKDIEFSYADRVDESDILEMYRLKTAQYTVSGPLVLGAILADADDETLKYLSDFGDCVGICFQIRDDILGMFGEETKLGKSVTSDMCEGKKTVLVSYLDRNADEPVKSRFYDIYGNEKSGEGELCVAREILKDTGALKYSEDMCVAYVEKAKEILNNMNFTTRAKELLSGLLEYMTSRNN